jgi:ribonuclease P protein component
MFPKYKRLKTKDVLFLTKKRKYFSNWFFGFFYIQQYPNRQYNQISFHVSIKYNKHATERNLIKRAVIKQAEILVKQWLFTKEQKIFITLNKNKIPILQKEFENKNKKDIILGIQNHFTQSFIALSRHLWNYSATSSITEKSS